jgi:two-component system, NarL family, response regulator NreC
MDINLPGESGIEAVPKLLQELPEVKDLVLSMQDDPRFVRKAFAAGAHGYVLKEAADSELVAAIREVARSGRYIQPLLGERLVEAARVEDELHSRHDPLSEQEHEVVSLLARGFTNQEIAQKLFISVRTTERRTAHTSCRSSASRRGPNSSATRSRTDCSRAEMT